MSLHVNELKGHLLNVLAELGIVAPYTIEEQDHAVENSNCLHDDQILLLQAYRSGQMEHWAWEKHLAEDPALRDYVEAMDKSGTSGR